MSSLRQNLQAESYLFYPFSQRHILFFNGSVGVGLSLLLSLPKCYHYTGCVNFSYCTIAFNM